MFTNTVSNNTESNNDPESESLRVEPQKRGFSNYL